VGSSDHDFKNDFICEEYGIFMRELKAKITYMKDWDIFLINSTKILEIEINMKKEKFESESVGKGLKAYVLLVST